MMSSPAELNAVAQVAALESPLTRLEQGLAGLHAALCDNDAEAIEQRAGELQSALAQAVRHFAQAAREGGVPPQLRQRLALASGRVAAQRESLARATAALDRAIDVLMPGHPSHGVYGAAGTTGRPNGSGYVVA